MDRSEKRTKKAFIGKVINLAGGHFKDDELNVLYDLVKFREQLCGLSKTYASNEKRRTKDGKELRITSITYTLIGNEKDAFVRERYDFIDVEGRKGSWNRDYRTAREILIVIGKIFR